VERGELALFSLGFSDLRLRLRGTGARLELPERQLARAEAEKEAIHAALEGFDSLELAGRRA
jgi:hypothetical protein